MRKSRVYSKASRKNLYKWAWNTKGKGKLKRIGKKMKSLSNQKGNGSKVTIRQLGRISELRQAYIKGYLKGKRRSY